MLDQEQWQGDAGLEVRRRVIALDRANQAVEEAVRDLRTARDEQKAAERDLETAKDVYSASRRDQDKRTGAPKITPQKREWLKSLAKHDGFGAVEMRAAAEAIGWQAKDDALRSLSADYRKAGYFVRVNHGFMRLNKDRITSAVGNIFEDDVVLHSQQPGTDATDDGPLPDISDTLSLPDLPDIPVAPPRRDDDLDFLNDDTPF